MKINFLKDELYKQFYPKISKVYYQTLYNESYEFVQLNVYNNEFNPLIISIIRFSFLKSCGFKMYMKKHPDNIIDIDYNFELLNISPSQKNMTRSSDPIENDIIMFVQTLFKLEKI